MIPFRVTKITKVFYLKSLELLHQNWSPLKSVRLDQFWQKNWFPRTTFAAKIGAARPILAAITGPLAKTCPPWGPILAKVYLPNWSPHKEVRLFACVHGCMDIAIATSQLSQNLPACMYSRAARPFVTILKSYFASQLELGRNCIAITWSS